eukprot:GHVR01181969.1.p1 GENE.GHVR01181969.1~~GHVR01181969.1.p1  ORF type:complete len:257 (+),score=86.36 GHVR01181969.1:102-872(+)
MSLFDILRKDPKDITANTIITSLQQYGKTQQTPTEGDMLILCDILNKTVTLRLPSICIPVCSAIQYFVSIGLYDRFGTSTNNTGIVYTSVVEALIISLTGLLKNLPSLHVSSCAIAASCAFVCECLYISEIKKDINIITNDINNRVIKLIYNIKDVFELSRSFKHISAASHRAITIGFSRIAHIGGNILKSQLEIIRDVLSASARAECECVSRTGRLGLTRLTWVHRQIYARHKDDKGQEHTHTHTHTHTQLPRSQ